MVYVGRGRGMSNFRVGVCLRKIFMAVTDMPAREISQALLTVRVRRTRRLVGTNREEASFAQKGAYVQYFPAFLIRFPPIRIYSEANVDNSLPANHMPVAWVCMCSSVRPAAPSRFVP